MANDDADFDALLNVSWDDIPDAIVLPTGDYSGELGNISLFLPREAGQAARVAIFVKLDGVVEVEDEDALAALGDDYDFGSGDDLTYQFFVRKASDWKQVAKTLSGLGIELSGAIVENGKINSETVQAVKGTKVVASIGVRSFEREGVMTTVNNVKRLSAIEE